MKETLEKLNDLVKTGSSENIELAFRLCDSQGITFSGIEIVKHYAPIIKWLSNYLDGYDDIKEGLVKAINLESLKLINKNIKSLPESIGLLYNLKVLSLCGNQLTNLPESIGNLVNLAWLTLDANSLTKITNSLSKLNKIEYINLSQNPIELSDPTTKEVIKCLRGKSAWVWITH